MSSAQVDVDGQGCVGAAVDVDFVCMAVTIVISPCTMACRLSTDACRDSTVLERLGGKWCGGVFDCSVGGVMDLRRAGCFIFRVLGFRVVMVTGVGRIFVGRRESLRDAARFVCLDLVRTRLALVVASSMSPETHKSQCIWATCSSAFAINTKVLMHDFYFLF